jgi:hypothetical protein
MPPAPSFADLLAQLRRHDPAAAAAVFRRYRHRLIGLARQQLDGRLRRKPDRGQVWGRSFPLPAACGRRPERRTETGREWAKQERPKPPG